MEIKMQEILSQMLQNYDQEISGGSYMLIVDIMVQIDITSIGLAMYNFQSRAC